MSYSKTFAERAGQEFEETLTERPAAKPGSINQWLNGKDTGSSSLCMARILTGIQTGIDRRFVLNPPPRDASDFGRCVRFLEAVPEAKSIELMAAITPQWKILVENWRPLERLYRTRKDRELSEQIHSLIGWL